MIHDALFQELERTLPPVFHIRLHQTCLADLFPQRHCPISMLWEKDLEGKSNLFKKLDISGTCLSHG